MKKLLLKKFIHWIQLVITNWTVPDYTRGGISTNPPSARNVQKIKRIFNFFFRKKKVQKDFGCQPISIPPLEHCEGLQEAETIISPPQEFRDVSKQNNLIPERFAWESYEEYKKRQKLAQLFLKKKKKGTLIFESQKIILDKTGREKERTKPKTFRGDTSKLK